MILQLFIFSGALCLLIHGATLATTYAAKVAANSKLSQYTIGFIVVAIISILPETFISVASSLNGIPAFGFGVPLGLFDTLTSQNSLRKVHCRVSFLDCMKLHSGDICVL